MNKSLEIIQGSSFTWLSLAKDVNKAPLDLTDFTITGNIKADFDDVDSVETFTITTLDKTGVIAAQAAGDIVLNAAELAGLLADTYGKVYMLVVLDADTTAGIEASTYVYSIRMENTAGYAETPYRGTLDILPSTLIPESSI